MDKARGRPAKRSKSEVVDIILKFRNEIMLPNNKIVSKSNIIWKEISKMLDLKVSESSLYSVVSCNRYNIRDKLKEVNLTSNVMIESSDFESVNNSSISINSTFATNNFSQTYDVQINKEEYYKLLVEKKCKRSMKTRCAPLIRTRKVLIPGMWQDIFNEKIASQTTITCGYRFKNNYISDDGKSGQFTGKHYKKNLS